MKKILFSSLLLAASMMVSAIPAKRGWQTLTQPDGTTVEVQLMGDEFYHFMVNRDGQQVKAGKDGFYQVVGQAPTPAKAKARHATNKARRVRKEFGVTPNLAPKGIVILVNYTDKSFKATNTHDVLDSLCNAVDCKVNKYGGKMYPSAAQYFSDQSHGKYNPVFDVYGPVPLSGNTAYYGANGDDGNDVRPGNMVVEACRLADELYDVDFTQYDSDNDGLIDFVYIIYAGKGEATGGGENTVWPHSYSIKEIMNDEAYFTEHPEVFKNWYGSSAEFVPYFSNEYSKEDCYVDGVMVNTYACSNEITGSSLDGIGTLCHEFGHVMGLPDFYDINYGVNSDEALTPGDWDVMDSGSYNGGGHCPPNYNAWEKYFFGWHTPVNLGEDPHSLTLQANGLDGYQAYQITAGNTLVGPTDSLKNNAACYYIENRQQQGWDSNLPTPGLVIWKVQYSKSAWIANSPNTVDYKPRFTIACSSGNTISSEYPEDVVFPNGSIKSWSGVTGKPIKNITEKNGLISLLYIDQPTHYYITWMVDGEVWETAKYAIDGSEDLVLPTEIPNACDEGTEFVGWTAEKQWFDPFALPEDLFNEANGKVTEDAVYTAVFMEVPLP